MALVWIVKNIMISCPTTQAYLTPYTLNLGFLIILMNKFYRPLSHNRNLFKVNIKKICKILRPQLLKIKVVITNSYRFMIEMSIKCILPKNMLKKK